MKPHAMTFADELVRRYPALTPLRDSVIAAVELIVAGYRSDRLVLVCGNGGSAADSGHIVGELAKGFLHRRDPGSDWLKSIDEILSADEKASMAKLQQGIRAIDLTSLNALNTAVVNDLSHDLIFAQGVFALGRPGDVLIGISTSGNSANVVRALQVGKARGLKTIGLTGANPARMDAWSDIALKVPATRTPEIQEFHLPIYHALCAMVEAELFA